MLKQTVFVQLDFSASESVSKEIKCQFVPDYFTVKQVTFAGEVGQESKLFALQSSLVDNNVMAIFNGNTNVHPELFFPVNSPVGGNYDFTLSGTIDDPRGWLYLALEFNKIKN